MAKKFNLAEYIDPADGSKADRMEITEVPFERIFQNWRNFYAVDGSEEELGESIKVSGLLTPLGVVRDGAPDRYKLISGHRRWRALRFLRDSEPDGRERWATVPCVIYATPEDADREQLMLIHANAQRVKSGAEIAREARETTEILCRMKERGVELPGRMRERVAEALQVSSTRLARLEAIEHNLTYPGWQRKWKEEKINESVAYRLSQLDYSQQMHTADWMIEHGVKDADISVRLIEEALAHPPLTNPGCADPLAYETDVVKVDRELARRMDAASRLEGCAFTNRKDGMDQLRIKFRNMAFANGELSWGGEPKGVRFRKPVECFLSWGALYDAMAANALDDALAAVSRPAPDAAPAQQTAAETQREAAPAGWHRCLVDEPREGAKVMVVWRGGFASLIYGDVRVYIDGQFHEPGRPLEDEDVLSIDSTMWWCEVAGLPAELTEDEYDA